MAKGDQKVEQNARAVAERREQAQLKGKPQLKTFHVKPSKGGGPVIVRFLEQGPDKNSYDVHEFKVPRTDGPGFYPRQETCLREAPWSQPTCPMCEKGIPLKLRGVYNLIQRQRAVYRVGQDQKPIKGPDGRYIVDVYSDQVVILNAPSTTAEVIRQKDAHYNGLMSRDLQLSDSANTFQPWTIEPVEIGTPSVPMSDADMALAAKKHNLDEFMKPPSAENAHHLISMYGANSGQSPNAAPVASPTGTAAQAGQAGGFLAGAAIPAGASGGAFAAAAAPPTSAPAQTQVTQAQPVPVSPAAPVPQQ